MSNFLSLNMSDVAKALALAAITAFIGAVQQALTAHGLEIGMYDWGAILNVTLSAAVAYLVKNVLSDEHGKVFGRIG